MRKIFITSLGLLLGFTVVAQHPDINIVVGGSSVTTTATPDNVTLLIESGIIKADTTKIATQYDLTPLAPKVNAVLTTPNIGSATGSITGNAGTVTGFTPASGSLTLSGADAITLTTTNTSNITLPTSGIMATTTSTHDSIVNMKAILGVNQVDLERLINLDSINHIYYVDNNGSDANSGLNVNQPFAHHPWMSTWTGSVVLSAGDVICMKRGNTWNISSPTAAYMTVTQSGTSGSPIITTAYGVGAKPIIKISTASNYAVVYASAKSYFTFNNLNIQHNSSAYSSSNLFGIYMVDVCHDVIIKNNEIYNIPNIAIYSEGDSYNIFIGDTTFTNTATSTNYSNNIHDFGYGGVVLEGVNPANSISNFKVYGNYIHDATRTNGGDNEYGISITANSASTAWPKYAYIYYNFVDNIKTWSAISTHGGSYMYFEYNYVRNFGRCGIKLGGTTGMPFGLLADHLYAEHNTIEQTAGGYYTGAASSFIGVGSGSNTFENTNMYVRDNTIYYVARPGSDLAFMGINLAGVNGVVISGNTIYNGAMVASGSAIEINGSSGYDNKNIVIENNFIKDWAPGIVFFGSLVTGQIDVINNIVKGSVGAAPFIIFEGLSSIAIFNAYNNIFSVATYKYAFYSDGGVASGGIFNAKNNIFDRAEVRSDGTYWYFGGTISGTFNCDYNIYHNSTSGTEPFYYGGSYRNWAYWTGTLGFDLNSPNTTASLDPLFKNTSGSYTFESDFDLQTTSPAINEGVDVAIDYLGTAPDIGAIEKR